MPLMPRDLPKTYIARLDPLDFSMKKAASLQLSVINSFLKTVYLFYNTDKTQAEISQDILYLHRRLYANHGTGRNAEALHLVQTLVHNF